jgi:hypothetical protein
VARVQVQNLGKVARVQKAGYEECKQVSVAVMDHPSTQSSVLLFNNISEISKKLLPLTCSCVFDLRSDSNQVLGNVYIDCKDVSGSLNSIMVHLSGESDSFSGNVFSAVDGKVYEDSRHQYATASVTTKPSYIVEALNPADVRAAVLFANACEHKVTARSGGHSYVGSSSCDGSVEACIQLDVSNLNAIDVSKTQVSVGPGVKLEDLYPVLIANGIFLPSGKLECL